MDSVIELKPPQDELISVRLEERSEGGRVAYITVDNQDKHNALPASGRRLLGEAIRRVSSDDDLRCVVLTGAGGKSFIGGANIGEMSEFPNARVAEEGSAQTHYACDSVRR
jgi:enoyl-CoA hydratase